MKTVVIMGAGGRDFHNFNVTFRDDPDTRVAAFTAAQIPGIDDRCYPAALAGPLYPNGIPIVPEDRLGALVAEEGVDEVILAYSDLSHEEVMHKASIAMAAGADFTLQGPTSTMIRSTRPVIAVCATRTGCGKSPTSRWIGAQLAATSVRVVLVRHPMPYGDLAAMNVQRFATQADIDAAHPTVEEREEYEEPVRQGLTMYAGVDYEAILRAAEQEADVIIWDGGNNDFPFFWPDVLIAVTDALRPGHELTYHPGEVNLRLADIVVINKVDSARPVDVAQIVANIEAVNPEAAIVKAASPVTMEPGPSLVGKRVLVIEDGPTITHGGMPFGAGTVAAREAGATVFVDPRPTAVGSIAETLARFPHITSVLPAMGYSEEQLADLATSVARAACDVVVTGTPIDLGRLVSLGHPVRHARYSYQDVGTPTLGSLLAPYIERWAPPAPR